LYRSAAAAREMSSRRFRPQSIDYGDEICFRPAKTTYACEDAVVNKSLSITVDGNLGDAVIDCRGSSRFAQVRSGAREISQVKFASLVLRGGNAAAGGLVYAEGVSLQLDNNHLSNSTSSCMVWQDQSDGQLFSSSDCDQTYPLHDHQLPPRYAQDSQELPLPKVGGGGGVYAVNCDMQVTGCSFHGLQAGSYGGAIFAVGGKRHNFTGNTFSDNYAPVVAAAVGLLYWASINHTVHHFADNVFHANRPTKLGGGGIGIFFFGAQHHFNKHSAWRNSFTDCVGGSGWKFGGGGGGGGLEE
jgi:hypothetical protein